MSNSPTPADRPPHLRQAVDMESVRNSLRVAAAPLRFVGFWLAVALPFLYLPLLAGGLQGNEPVTFVALLGLNAVSLVLGHDHAR